MGQIVGQRQRFEPFDQKRVLERGSRRFQKRPHGTKRAWRQPRLARRRHAIEADERADRVAPADQRERQHRPGRRIRYALVGP